MNITTIDHRKAARLVLFKIIMPEIIKKFISKMDKSKGDNFRVLGRVIGSKEKEMTEQIQSIKTIKDLKQFSIDYSLKTIENCIQVEYVRSLFGKVRKEFIHIESKLVNGSADKSSDTTNDDNMILHAVARQFNVPIDKVKDYTH